MGGGPPGWGGGLSVWSLGVGGGVGLSLRVWGP